jgi:hypothetical protein
VSPDEDRRAFIAEAAAEVMHRLGLSGS